MEDQKQLFGGEREVVRNRHCTKKYTYTEILEFKLGETFSSTNVFNSI